MAQISVASSYGLDMSKLDFSTLFYGDQYQQSSSRYLIFYDSGETLEFRGAGFKFNTDGVPTGGTVKSYAYFYNGRQWIADGLNVSVKSIVSAANTFSSGDDKKVIETALSGNDRLGGGAFSDTLYGYGGNDELFGNGSADWLYGGAGNDKIVGGDGADYMRGDKGADTFVFKESIGHRSTVDTIADFSSKDDTIALEDRFFKAEHDKANHIVASQFKDLSLKGAKVDGDDRVIYDKTGYLFYDKDGSGKASGVIITCFDHHPKVVAGDILMI